MVNGIVRFAKWERMPTLFKKYFKISRFRVRVTVVFVNMVQKALFSVPTSYRFFVVSRYLFSKFCPECTVPVPNDLQQRYRLKVNHEKVPTFPGPPL